MSQPSSRRPLHLALIGVAIATLAWGALAFGAVYPWAYTPLAVTAGLVGLAGLIVTRAGHPPLRALMMGMTAIGAAIALQLVPLPQAAIARVSPHADEFRRQYDASYGLVRPNLAAPDPAENAEPAARSLSIAATRTAVGLSLFMPLALFFLGTARLLSVTGGLPLVRPIIGFGILLALVGIGQYTLTLHEIHPLIYGFWKPQFDTRPFGPFVNPNHFAGWMLMVLPIGLALFYEALQRTIETAAGRSRNRVSIVSLPEFGRTLTFGFASVVLGLSLVMTRSRSGVAAVAVGSLLALWITFRRQRSATARVAVIVSFLVLLGGAGAWAGLDSLVGKVLRTDATNESLGGRLGAWNDTFRIIHDFPLAGTGFNAYGTAMSVYQSSSRSVHFQEAHNDYFQLAAEGGLLLGVPIFVTLGIFVRDVRRRFREAPRDGTTYWLRVGAVIALISIGVQSLVEFSLQMPGNAALFAVIAAIAVHQSPNLRRAASSRSADL